MGILKEVFSWLAKAVPPDTKEIASRHFEDVAAELKKLRSAIDKHEGVERDMLGLAQSSTNRNFLALAKGDMLTVQISNASSYRNKGFPIGYTVAWDNGQYHFKYNADDSIRVQHFSHMKPLIIAGTKRLLSEWFRSDELAGIEQHVLNSSAIDVVAQSEPLKLTDRIKTSPGDRLR